MHAIAGALDDRVVALIANLRDEPVIATVVLGDERRTTLIRPQQHDRLVFHHR